MKFRWLKCCVYVFAIVFSVQTDIFAATASTPTTNDNKPNDVFQGAAIAGQNTYSQLDLGDSPTFTFTSGTLVLTGNSAGGQLIKSGVTPYPSFTMNNRAAPTTLVIQKGTFAGSIDLWSRNSATLIIGSGSATPRGTVTINRPNADTHYALGGLPMGASTPGGSVLETRGAHLEIIGVVAGSGYIGEMRAWNGNINMSETRAGPSNQIGYLSVYGGQTVTSNAPLVLVQNLDLWAGSKVVVNSETRIQTLIHNQPVTINGQTYTGMKKGSLLHSTGNIIFRTKLQAPNAGLCGINGASGTISTEQSIEGWDHTRSGNPRIDLLQGAGGELHLIAGQQIEARDIDAYEVTAGQNIIARNLTGQTLEATANDITVSEKISGGSAVAGRDITANEISGNASAGRDVAATTTITGGAISAGRNIRATTLAASSMNAGQDIVALAINGGAAIAGNDITADTINGSAQAGRNITAQTISGGVIDAGHILSASALSGTEMKAGQDIVAENVSGGAASAGRDIAVQGMNVKAATAGRNIVSGTAPAAGQISITAGDSRLSPTGTITAGSLSAELVAAGEISQKSGVPGRIEAGHLLVVKNPGDAGSSGNVTLSGGSFALTGTEPVGAADYGADGQIVSRSQASWVGGNLDVANSGESSFTTLGVGGATRIAGGSLRGGGLYTGSALLHGGINATLDSVHITDAASGFMQIGEAADKAASTRVAIGSLTLNGRDLRAGAGAGSASAAINDFGASGSLVDGNAYVGHNGMLALGTSNAEWLPQMAPRAAMPADAAVFGVGNPITLAQGLFVDSAWSQPQASARSRAAQAGQIEFSPNSLFVMDGGKAGAYYENPSVPTRSLPADAPGSISASAPKIANVQGGSKIYINHVTPGHTYVALGRNITTQYADATAWNGENLLSSNPLLGLERLGNGMEGQFGVGEKAPQIKHVAAASGVPRMARSVSEAMEEAIYHRIRLGQEDLYRRSYALWALPLYERINQFDLDGGTHSYGFNGGLGGIAIGGDYTWENTLRLGLAFNIGAGYAQSTGEMAATKNHINFWGAGAYAVWKPGQFSLDADIDFTSTYNKLKQELPAGLPAPEVKADVPAWALGLSLRAQYEFDTDWLIIRPHVGARYFHLNTSPYDVTMSGQDVLRAHRSYQNVWTFPFGIVFTKEIKLDNGYEILPLLNLKVIPASGDIYVKNSIRYADSIRDIDLDTQVMDNITYGGRAGIEFRGGNFSLGVNYMAQFGSHTANQGVFGVLRYEF